MRFPKKLGMLCLSIWLVLTGVFVMWPSLAFNGSQGVLAILAIAAGILLFLDR